uniref:MFS domain-containing protein n=1 Tax=Panagrellus redivivus TaxID=6233 RepID=A0A7E4VTC6_PANRE
MTVSFPIEMPSDSSDEAPIIPSVATYQDAAVQCRSNIASCGHKTRYIVLIQGALFLAIIMSSVIAWNATSIAIQDITTSPIYDPNVTKTADEYMSSDLAIKDRRIPYCTVEKSTLFAAVFIGGLGGVVPLNMLLQKWGAHKCMTLMGVLSVLTTALTPIVAVTDFKLLVALRIIQGTTLSNPFPVIGMITNTWSTLMESGLFVSVLTGYIQISAIFTMPVTGAVATSVGWDAVFYIHAGVCAVLCALWTYNFRDEPHRHQFVSEKEVSRISAGRVQVPVKYNPPYRAIFTDIRIWACWIPTCFSFLVAQFCITYTPMYLVYVCGLPLSLGSTLSAIPLILQFIIKFLTGAISDRLTSVSNLVKVRVFNSLAFFGCGAMLIVNALVPPAVPVLSVILILLALAFIGFNVGGFMKSAVLVSKQYSPTVMAVIQCLLCLSLFGGSYLVPSLTPDGTHAQYSIVFFIYAAGLICSNVFFLIFGRAEPAEWTREGTASGNTVAPVNGGTADNDIESGKGNLPAVIPSLIVEKVENEPER